MPTSRRHSSRHQHGRHQHPFPDGLVLVAGAPFHFTFYTFCFLQEPLPAYMLAAVALLFTLAIRYAKES